MAIRIDAEVDSIDCVHMGAHIIHKRVPLSWSRSLSKTMVVHKPQLGGGARFTKARTLNTPSELNNVQAPASLAGANPRSVMVVDDHPIARAGIISLLSVHDWLVVIGQAADGQEALTKAKALAPDLIVVDINLPKLSGLALTKSLHAELPDSRVIILSMHGFDQVAEPVLESGARGYVCKRVATEELVEALEKVASGGAYFPAFSRNGVQGEGSRQEHPGKRREISPRERQVLVGIAEGLSNKEVAERLSLGVRTIETHRGALMRKLDIHTVAGLTRFALQQGLVPRAAA